MMATQMTTVRPIMAAIKVFWWAMISELSLTAGGAYGSAILPLHIGVTGAGTGTTGVGGFTSGFGFESSF